ncbi:hypothetical protein B0H11DRAFT_1949221 [Mycena galericulata]|nr:hypothetical protein B0H11DRAFT_1949221 [Mycena galericulata]
MKFTVHQMALIAVGLATCSPAPETASVLLRETLHQHTQQETAVAFWTHHIVNSVIRWTGDHCVNFVTDPTSDVAEGLEGCALLYLGAECGGASPPAEIRAGERIDLAGHVLSLRAC